MTEREPIGPRTTEFLRNVARSIDMQVLNISAHGLTDQAGELRKLSAMLVARTYPRVKARGECADKEG